MATAEINLGDMGGGGPITYQLTQSRQLNFFICANGVVVSRKGNDQGTSYDDDYITVLRSSNSVTLTVKKACTVYKYTAQGASVEAAETSVICTPNQQLSLTFTVANTGVEFVNIVFD